MANVEKGQVNERVEVVEIKLIVSEQPSSMGKTDLEAKKSLIKVEKNDIIENENVGNIRPNSQSVSSSSTNSKTSSSSGPSSSSELNPYQ